MTSPAPVARPGSGAVLPVLAAVVAGLLHLVAGYFYAVSGLVAPGWAVLALLAWWVVLWFAFARYAGRRSYLVLAVPLVTVVTWVAMMWFGDVVLGWTP